MTLEIINFGTRINQLSTKKRFSGDRLALKS